MGTPAVIAYGWFAVAGFGAGLTVGVTATRRDALRDVVPPSSESVGK